MRTWLPIDSFPRLFAHSLSNPLACLANLPQPTDLATPILPGASADRPWSAATGEIRPSHDPGFSIL